MKEIDLKYHSLKKYWKVELETELPITKSDSKSRPPSISLVLGEGDENGGYRLVISTDMVCIYGEGFGTGSPHSPGYGDSVIRLENFSRVSGYLQVGKSKEFQHGRSITCKVTRLS
jgi:hypothetical protein